MRPGCDRASLPAAATTTTSRSTAYCTALRIAGSSTPTANDRFSTGPGPRRPGGGGDHLGGRLREGAVEAHRGDPASGAIPSTRSSPAARAAMIPAMGVPWFSQSSPCRAPARTPRRSARCGSRPVARPRPRAWGGGRRRRSRRRRRSPRGRSTAPTRGAAPAGRSAVPGPPPAGAVRRARRFAARGERRGRGGRRRPLSATTRARTVAARRLPTPGSPAAACRRPTRPARPARPRAAAASPARRGRATAGRAAGSPPRTATAHGHATEHQRDQRHHGEAHHPARPARGDGPHRAHEDHGDGGQRGGDLGAVPEQPGAQQQENSGCAARTAGQGRWVRGEGDDGERGRHITADEQAGQQGPGPAHPVSIRSSSSCPGPRRGPPRCAGTGPGDPGTAQRQRRRTVVTPEGADHGGGRAGSARVTGQQPAEQALQRGDPEARGTPRRRRRRARARSRRPAPPPRPPTTRCAAPTGGPSSTTRTLPRYGGQRAEQGAGRHVARGVRECCAPAEQQQRQHAEQDPGERAPNVTADHTAPSTASVPSTAPATRVSRADQPDSAAPSRAPPPRRRRAARRPTRVRGAAAAAHPRGPRRRPGRPRGRAGRRRAG